MKENIKKKGLKRKSNYSGFVDDALSFKFGGGVDFVALVDPRAVHVNLR